MEYLLQLLIEKIENSENQWKPGANGWKSLSNKAGNLYDDRKHLKSDVVKAAKELEKTGLVKIEWVQGYREQDIQAIRYRQEDIPALYKLYRERVDSDFCARAELVRKYQEEIRAELQVLRTPWIRAYYEKLLQESESGRAKKATLEKAWKFFRKRKACWRGIDELEDPMYKRLFSKKYLKDTKIFENEFQDFIVSTAKIYAKELLDDAMNDSEILSALLIEDYAQELALKGPLHLKWEDGTEIHNEDWRYGNILNSDTLRYAQIAGQQPEIQRVITIENKANYMMMPLEEHTLYIFTHGFFSPKECRFLQSLNQVLEHTEVEFYHSGDLDYGGIKIFLYIQKNIFPELQPLMMDVRTYEQYRDYAEKIEDTTLEKLKKLQIENPVLRQLAEKLVKEKKGIEQESFLL